MFKDCKNKKNSRERGMLNTDCSEILGYISSFVKGNNKKKAWRVSQDVVNDDDDDGGRKKHWSENSSEDKR